MCIAKGPVSGRDTTMSSAMMNFIVDSFSSAGIHARGIQNYVAMASRVCPPNEASMAGQDIVRQGR
jgi:hypothetical protein